MSTLREIWIAAGRPGVAKLRAAAKRQGFAISAQEAKKLVEGEPTSQVFAPAPKSAGKVTSPELNHTWQGDLIDYSAKDPSSNNGNRFALVVTDVFSRKTYTEKLTNKDPATVLAGYKKIVAEAGEDPKQLTTDNGQEFSGVFDRYLKENSTVHAFKEQQNHLAVVDAAIKTLKDIMKKEITDTKSKGWTKAIDKATKAINSNSHPAVMNTAPDDVKGSDVLQYELEKKAGEDMAQNAKVQEDRVKKLKEAGAFRIILPRSTWVRAGQPRWSDKVYTLKETNTIEAVATDGTTVLIRDALPVPLGTKDTDVPRVLRGGRQTRDQDSRETLQPYANALIKAVEAGPISLQAAGILMRRQAGFTDALITAKITGVGALKRFIDLYPDLAIDGRAPNAKVRKVEPARVEPTAQAARVGPGNEQIRIAPLPRGGAVAPARPEVPNSATLRGGGLIRIARLPVSRRQN